MTKAALYYHFPAKANLLQQLTVPLIDETSTLLDRYSGRPLDDLGRRDLLTAFADLLFAHRSVVVWLSRDVSALVQPEINAHIAANNEHLRSLLASPGDGMIGQIRVAAAVGALVIPFAVLAADADAIMWHDARNVLIDAAMGALERASSQHHTGR